MLRLIINDAFALYVILTILAPLIFYLVSVILAPSRPSRVKRMPFESGQAPIPYRVNPFPIEYFPYVIIYVAYALLALVAFLSVLSLMETGEAAIRGLIVLGIITFGSLYLNVYLNRLVQRIERRGS